MSVSRDSDARQHFWFDDELIEDVSLAKCQKKPQPLSHLCQGRDKRCGKFSEAERTSFKVFDQLRVLLWNRFDSYVKTRFPDNPR